jgi:hypothetical protein
MGTRTPICLSWPFCKQFFTHAKMLGTSVHCSFWPRQHGLKSGVHVFFWTTQPKQFWHWHSGQVMQIRCILNWCSWSNVYATWLQVEFLTTISLRVSDGFRLSITISTWTGLLVPRWSVNKPQLHSPMLQQYDVEPDLPHGIGCTMPWL